MTYHKIKLQQPHPSLPPIESRAEQIITRPSYSSAPQANAYRILPAQPPLLPKQGNAIKLVSVLVACFTFLFGAGLFCAYRNENYAPVELCSFVDHLTQARYAPQEPLTEIIARAVSQLSVADGRLSLTDGTTHKDSLYLSLMDPSADPSPPTADPAAHPQIPSLAPNIPFSDSGEQKNPLSIASNDGTLSEPNGIATDPDAPTPEVPVFSEDAQVYGESGGKAYPLIALDLSKGSDKIYFNNETKFQPDLAALQKSPYRPTITDYSQPLVLILHTHGTESYTTSTGQYYDETEETRSTDTSQNVVRVGQELADVLNSFGIRTLHCETMHDQESFLTAYNNSRKTVADYLTKYPSIRYVIDVHRDSIIRDNNEQVKPLVTINGENAAQVMLVVGTDAGGAKHPNWQTNLSLALSLQQKMNDRVPGLARPINLRSASFNQQLSDGYLLLETGASGNTLEEALRAIRLFAVCYADEILHQG